MNDSNQNTNPIPELEVEVKTKNEPTEMIVTEEGATPSHYTTNSVHIKTDAEDLNIPKCKNGKDPNTQYRGSNIMGTNLG